jgi:hypothetical protein
MSMFKRSAATAAVLAALAFVVAGPASAHNWYWSAPTAERALESADYAWRTATTRVHVNSATCHGFGRYRVGDARRLFQHFRCSTEGQLFDTARERAAKKALEDARARFKAAAAGADEATRTALYAPVQEAEDRYLRIQGGTHHRFKLVLHVKAQYLGSVSNVVRTSRALPVPISPIPVRDDDPIVVGP